MGPDAPGECSKRRSWPHAMGGAGLIVQARQGGPRHGTATAHWRRGEGGGSLRPLCVTLACSESVVPSISGCRAVGRSTGEVAETATMKPWHRDSFSCGVLPDTPSRSNCRPMALTACRTCVCRHRNRRDAGGLRPVQAGDVGPGRRSHRCPVCRPAQGCFGLNRPPVLRTRPGPPRRLTVEGTASVTTSGQVLRPGCGPSATVRGCPSGPPSPSPPSSSSSGRSAIGR